MDKTLGYGPGAASSTLAIPTKTETMKKINTLFKKDPTNLGRVINEVNENNTWVINGEAIATRKFDGTSCAIIDGELYKRFDLKKGRILPNGAIPCQDADPKSGHHPHWVKCDLGDASDKWHFAAFDRLTNPEDGTYELCGEKIQRNPEKITGHELIKHGIEQIEVSDFSFEGIRNLLAAMDIEGIVFHHKTDGRMCKIRKKDFGLKR